MAQLYEKDKNLINDFIVELIQSDFDFTDKNATFDVYEILVGFLENFLEDENDIKYLDFDIVFGADKNDIKIKANNIVCGLWFCGLIPRDSDKIYDDNMFIYNSIRYKFNKKTGIIIKTKM